MDVKLLRPFVESINEVMPQLGFSSVVLKSTDVKGKKMQVSGVIITIGIVGDKKGNVVYNIDLNGAKQIASTMMMGMSVEEFDEMAKSAISELSNMLTANATIKLADMGFGVDISVPALMYGEDIEVNVNVEKVFCVNFDVDGISLAANVALE